MRNNGRQFVNRTFFTKIFFGGFARRKLLIPSRTLLGISGCAALLVLALGFKHVHCSANCGSIIKFQYFHYRNLLLAFVAVQAFGWYIHFEEKVGSSRWNVVLSAILMLITAWTYAVIFQWDKLATFYFGHIGPVMNRFLLL